MNDKGGRKKEEKGGQHKQSKQKSVMSDRAIHRDLPLSLYTLRPSPSSHRPPLLSPLARLHSPLFLLFLSPADLPKQGIGVHQVGPSCVLCLCPPSCIIPGASNVQAYSPPALAPTFSTPYSTLPELSVAFAVADPCSLALLFVPTLTTNSLPVETYLLSAA